MDAKDFPLGEPQAAVFPVIVLGLAYSVVAFAGQLADQQMAYQGQWRLGIRMDRLRGVVPADRKIGSGFGPFGRMGNPYTQDEYVQVTEASTDELIN